MSWLRHSLLLAATVVVATLDAGGQGAFRNLDFEGANLPPIPAGHSGNFVNISNGMPGWSGYLGTMAVTQVLQNNYNLGNAGLSILGPTWTDSNLPIIQGNYTALLQAGLGFNGNDVSASIDQTSLVPITAESIQMKVKPVVGPSSLSFLGVTVGGQNISMIPLSVQPNYTLMGGDVSAFAGQTEALSISALSAPGFLFNSLELDSIVFSSQTVPEPGAWALLCGGGLLFGIRYWRRRA